MPYTMIGRNLKGIKWGLPLFDVIAPKSGLQLFMSFIVVG